MEIKEKAWAASAEALKQNLLGYAPDILSLSYNGEELFEDQSKACCLRIDPGVGGSFPVIDVPFEKGRKRSPGANITIMVRALKLLIFARIWREKATKAPPAGLIYTNRLTKRIIDRYGIKPQDFVDSIWQPVKIFEKYDDWAEWQSDKPFPKLLKRDPVEKRAVHTLSEKLPWVSGYTKHTHAIIDTVALSDDAVLKMHVISTRPLELRLSPGMPATVVESIKGRRVNDVVKHPLLQSQEAWIEDVKVHAKSTRLTIYDPTMGWDRVAMKGGNAERLEFRKRMKDMKAEREQLEAIIRMNLTVPGKFVESVEEYPMADVIRQMSRSWEAHDLDAKELDQWLERYIHSDDMDETDMPGFSREQYDAIMRTLLQQRINLEMQDDPLLSSGEAEALSERDWETPSILQGM